MKVFSLFAHRPVVLPLAIAATVAMVTISEVAYSQSVATLDLIDAQMRTLAVPGMALSRDALLQTLILSRIGVAVLSLICFVALFMVLRQGLVLQQQQQVLKRLAEVEHGKLEVVVAQRTVQLIELTHHLQTAREDERNRLARDLHDELGALLTSAKLDAARIRSRLAGLQPEALERLAHLVQSLDHVIAFKRRITEDLRPSALTHLGLVATLQIQTAEFAEASGTPVHCALQPVPLTPAAELTVYRLVQEAITNISKYARASQVWVSLDRLGDAVRLVVRDDGVGFDADVQPRSAHGLLGMRYRVLAEGGTLQLATAPGLGTRIEVMLPAAVPA